VIYVAVAFNRSISLRNQSLLSSPLFGINQYFRPAIKIVFGA
jgi:hypothetical protein